MFEIVKDKVMYHASARNYKVGDVLEFGKERNYQAVRAYEQGFKLNGKLLKTSNAFNDRGLSFDDTVENAKKYFNGIDDSFENKKSIEYLFEGKAEVVEIITQ